MSLPLRPRPRPTLTAQLNVDSLLDGVRDDRTIHPCSVRISSSRAREPFRQGGDICRARTLPEEALAAAGENMSPPPGVARHMAVPVGSPPFVSSRDRVLVARRSRAGFQEMLRIIDSESKGPPCA